MGLKDTIKTAKKAVETFFGGAEKPGVEFYPHDRKEVDEDFAAYVLERYKDSDKKVEEVLPKLIANRKAYLGDTYDHFRGWATARDEDGEEAHYTSDIVADKINDLIAMQTQGGIKLYPLPNLDESSQIYQGLAQEIGENDARKYFRKVWEKVFDDIHQRKKMNKKDILVILDAYLGGYGITKQTQKYDWKTGQLDVNIDLVIQENYLRDYGSIDFENMKFCFEKNYMHPYEAMQLLPEHKEEVLRAVIDSKYVEKISSRSFYAGKLLDRKKGMVLVAEGYFRDDTIIKEKVVKAVPNAETGEMEEVEETITRRKYPNGRRVYLLPDIDYVAIDEESPYPGFPYAVYEPFPVSWDLDGKNATNPLRALQLSDDDVIQRAISNLKALGSHIMVYDPESVEDPEKISNKVAMKVPAGNPHDVTFIKAQGIMVDALQAHGVIQTDSNRISGVESVAEGRPVGSLTSGVALNTLLQGTIRKVQPRNRLYADFKQEQGKQMADLALDLYRAGRVMRVSDQAGVPMRLQNDLIEFTEGIDVRVDSDSKFPSSGPELFRMLLQLLPVVMPDGGPVVDREAFTELMDWPGAREMNERIDAQIEQQNAMKEAMAAQEGRNAPQPNRGTGSQPNLMKVMNSSEGQAGTFAG